MCSSNNCFQCVLRRSKLSNTAKAKACFPLTFYFLSGGFALKTAGSLCVTVTICPSCVFLSTPSPRISLGKTVVFKDGHVMLCPSMLWNLEFPHCKVEGFPPFECGRRLWLLALMEHDGSSTMVSKAGLLNVIPFMPCELKHLGLAHYRNKPLFQCHHNVRKPA